MPEIGPPTKITPERFDACLFDLDGVLTKTASVHAAAWKQTFDEYLRRRARRDHERFVPFDLGADYTAYVDGKPRYDGVRSFLESRGIHLPEGAPSDPPDAETVCGVGNKKDALVKEIIATKGVEAYAGSVRLLRAVRAAGIKTAIVSSSKNCLAVITAVGIVDDFDARVDGDAVEHDHLAGKPAPDTYLAAAKQLGVEPARAVVFEDALSGVESGRAGNFGLVVGVDREHDADELRAHGADIVVTDLAELIPGMIDHPAYEVTGWKIREKKLDLDTLAQGETLLAVANGYLGLRGNLDEGLPVAEAGTYVNAFYETRDIHYPESAYGYAKHDQVMLNVTDGKIIRLAVDGEPLDMRHGRLHHHHRELDMRMGVLARELTWESPKGRQVKVRSRRLVSFAHRHLAAIEYEVEVVDAPAELVVSSELLATEAGSSERVHTDDPREAAVIDFSRFEPVLSRGEDLRILLGHRTMASALTLVCGADHEVHTDCEHSIRTIHTDALATVSFRVAAEPGRTFRLVKYLVYEDSDDDHAGHLAALVGEKLDHGLRTGFDTLVTEQQRFLDALWTRGDVEVEGDPDLQHAVRFSLFQILQAAARADGRGIPAKGLTGRGYEGHYFWDMETFVFSVLTFTVPYAARHLLAYRAGTLDVARARAAELGHHGALFPWRTIDGEEASSYFPAGTAAYHIDADIAYAIRKYVGATGDDLSLWRHGIDVLVETARFWMSLGFFSERAGGRFCIHEVTGPDEYSALVDDNLYTNVMAAANLETAAREVVRLAEEDPDEHDRMSSRLRLEPAEVEQWRRAAESVTIPYDDALGVHGQDDRFLEHEVWDLAGTPRDRFPLLLHFHPLDIYRKQVVKQADVVMALFLVGHRFTSEDKRKDFDYYEALTTGDSSLSACVQGVVAAEVGHLELAYRHARTSALVDLENRQANVRDGIHIAAMAGTWISLVHGLAGMRDWDGALHFAPQLPKALTRLRFRVVFRDRTLDVEITKRDTTYSIREGADLELTHWGAPLTVPAGGSTTARIPPPSKRTGPWPT